MPKHKAERPTGPSIGEPQLFYIIVKAREFDVKEPPVEPDPGSNPSDDGDREILGDYADDPTYSELLGAINGLSEDEQAELVALAWLGRGDYGPHEWREALELARERHTADTARYLAGMPNLGDLLEEGYALFGRSLEDREVDRL